MRKKLSIMLIIIGIIVLLYPSMEQGFTRYWQRRLLADWESPNEVSTFGLLDNLLQIEFEYEAQEEPTVPLSPQGEMLGVLIIDSINLRLPIISGLNEINLKIGVSYLEETARFGEFGNTVLAGHRGHSYGRLLNRLNELRPGDEITIYTRDGEFNYKVYDILIVEPQELQVLYTDKKEKLLSIVTCEPIRNPTHRLIVKARLVS